MMEVHRPAPASITGLWRQLYPRCQQIETRGSPIVALMEEWSVNPSTVKENLANLLTVNGLLISFI